MQYLSYCTQTFFVVYFDVAYFNVALDRAKVRDIYRVWKSNLAVTTVRIRISRIVVQRPRAKKDPRPLYPLIYIAYNGK